MFNVSRNEQPGNALLTILRDQIRFRACPLAIFMCGRLVSAEPCVMPRYFYRCCGMSWGEPVRTRVSRKCWFCGIRTHYIDIIWWGFPRLRQYARYCTKWRKFAIANLCVVGWRHSTRYHSLIRWAHRADLLRSLAVFAPEGPSTWLERFIHPGTWIAIWW